MASDIKTFPESFHHQDLLILQANREDETKKSLLSIFSESEAKHSLWANHNASYAAETSTIMD